MESLIINDGNLQMNDIDDFSSKVRGILLDEDDRVLVANYGRVILLPGGSIDRDNSNIDALIRELKEELGITYTEEELDYLMCLEYYQKDYPKRDGTVINRLVRTYYYVGKFKGLLESTQVLTEREKNDNFQLSLVPYDELAGLVMENKNDNPRNVYFQNELLAVSQLYRPGTSNIDDRPKVKKNAN